jgi:heptosyltransferase-2
MTVRRILLRLPNWLGDLLLARPLVHALRAAHPEAEIAAVGPRPLLDLLGTDGVIDRLVPWPRGRDENTGRRRALDDLRAWHPEAALVLPPSFSSAWFAWRTHAPVRVGYRHEARSPLLTHALKRPPRGDQHLSREYLALGAPVGAREVVLPPLRPTPAGRDRAAAVLEARGLAGRPYVVLGPGAIYGPAKRWPVERFVALGRALVRRGLAVLACGADSERETCEAVAHGIGPAATSLAGETDLEAQTALCASARVAVCNDSGLAHLAAATGAPTVALFGSTSSAWTAPLGPSVRVVQHAPVCSPCFQRTCRIGTICLMAIEVDEVERASLELSA